MMKIGNRIIGEGKCFIIAELSANHNNNLNIAIKSVVEAAKSGADAIKLQTYTADTITLNHNSPDFMTQSDGPWAGRTLHSLYKEAYTPWEWHEEIFRIAKEEGIECFSSPFDFTAVDFLETLNTPAYKIASFEINDLPLIEYVAKKNKPVIISTGIASYEDILNAIETCKNAGNNDIILLKCTSSYPAPIEEANLVMIKDYAAEFGVLAGLSDHTLGIVSPIVAITQGAVVIEKHFILDRAIGGPDSAFSLNIEEFSLMVKSIREAEKAIGEINYSLTPKQLKSKEHSRSIYPIADINAGEIITKNNVQIIRPGYSLQPRYYYQILGQKALVNIKKGERMTIDQIMIPK